MPIISGTTIGEDAMRRVMEALGQSPEHQKIPDPEAIVMELRERLATYTTCKDVIPYKVGDIITPRRGSGVRGQGLPHIVVEVNPTAKPDFGVGNCGSVTYGCRPQMRTISLNQGDYVCFWNEAHVFEPYDPAIHSPQVDDDD